MRIRIRLAVCLAVVVTLLSCSPVVRLRTRVVVPRGTPASQAALKVTIVAAKTAAEAARPAPGAPQSDRLMNLEVTPKDDGFVVQGTIHGQQAWVNVTAWLDVNGNGAVDRGDAVGHLDPAPVLARDHGLFRGNLTETAPIVLVPVP
jgi:hypothetical protein